MRVRVWVVWGGWWREEGRVYKGDGRRVGMDTCAGIASVMQHHTLMYTMEHHRRIWRYCAE